MTPPQFLELFLSLSVQAAIVVAITHWLARAAHDELTKCRLWVACHTLLLILVGVGLLLPHMRLFYPWSAVAGESAVALLKLQQGLGWAAFGIWIAGFIVALIAFVVRTAQINHFVKACEKIDCDDFATGLDGDAWGFDHAGHQRMVTVLASDAVAGPFCWQFHRPYIVVPDHLLGLDRRQLQLIIRHELAHLQAGHPVQLFVQRVVEMIFWFHPMVWWSSHESALVREFVCDAAVVDSPAGVTDYLHTLLAVIQAGTGRPEVPSVSIHFGRGKSMIAKRANRLVAIARGVKPHNSPRLAPLTAYTLLAVSAVMVSLVHVPANISAAGKSSWSPWPTWSAQVLHDFGIQARDFETYDHGFQEVSEMLVEKQHQIRD